MRATTALFLISIAAAGSFGIGCRSSSTPSPVQGEVSPAAVAVGRFSGERAWKHLEALAAIGPRSVGTPGAEKARAYITTELAALELGVDPLSASIRYGDDDQPLTVELVSLAATIPGKSDDLILLMAPYDSAYRENFRFVGVNDGASGSAVLLELARLLAANPLPYTTRFVFLDAEAPLGRGTAEDEASALIGSQSFAQILQQSGGFPKVRLLVYLNRVSSADLRIARDRFSHRIYRDAFWKAAGRLGHRDVFPVDTDYEAPNSGHRIFFDRGLRRVVTIEDTGARDGGAEPPRHTEDDTLAHSSQESLAIVGQVVLTGLRDIGASLERIDRFSEAPTVPVQDLPAPAPEPEPEPASAEEPAAVESDAPAPAPEAPVAPEASEVPVAPEAPDATKPEAPPAAESEAPAT